MNQQLTKPADLLLHYNYGATAVMQRGKEFRVGTYYLKDRTKMERSKDAGTHNRVGTYNIKSSSKIRERHSLYKCIYELERFSGCCDVNTMIATKI